MGDLLRPIANLPLTIARPTDSLFSRTIVNLKGCIFNPGVYLKSGVYYFINITRGTFFQTPKGNWVIVQSTGERQFMNGFYGLPDNRVVFIRDFKPVAISAPNEFGYRGWIFEAIPGEVPKDWLPDKEFDYARYEIEEVIQRRTERLESLQ
jgi:hypothetical protein